MPGLSRYQDICPKPSPTDFWILFHILEAQTSYPLVRLKTKKLEASSRFFEDSCEDSGCVVFHDNDSAVQVHSPCQVLKQEASSHQQSERGSMGTFFRSYCILFCHQKQTQAFDSMQCLSLLLMAEQDAIRSAWCITIQAGLFGPM